MPETAQANGTNEEREMQNESFIRKYIWCFLFLCLIAFGSFLVFFEYQQQPITATIILVGKTTTRTRRFRRHGRSTTSYHTTLTVMYDEDGEEKKDDVKYTYLNYWFPPKAGEQVQITTGLLGNKVQYPEKNLKVIGWTIILFGGIFLGFAIRIVLVNRKENPYLIDHGNGDSVPIPGRAELMTQSITRLPNGTYCWTCAVDDAYEKNAYKITMLSCGGICAFLLIMTLLFMRDTETLLIVSGCCAFVMLLAFGLSKLFFTGPGHLKIPYEMTDESIKIGSGKGSRYVSYKNVQQTEIKGNKIRLYTKFGSSVVFIPEEDFEVISGYILQRIREESGEYRN